MIRFVIRRFPAMVVTVLAASILVFIVVELAPVDLANKVLGQFVTPEQKDRWRERNGMNQSPVIRYLDWLVGSDWRVGGLTDYKLVTVADETGDQHWWALDENGDLVRWTMEEGELIEIRRPLLGESERIAYLESQRETYMCSQSQCTLIEADGAGTVTPRAEIEAACTTDEKCHWLTPKEAMKDDRVRRRLTVACRGDECWLEEGVEGPAGDVWQQEEGTLTFWGVDTDDHLVMWQQDVVIEEEKYAAAGQAQSIESGGIKYYPLQRGFLRGDPGRSFLTGRPVGSTLFSRLFNSIWLAVLAFVIIMPAALVTGIIAGLRERKPIDRVISVASLLTTATPQFTTGILLILFFVIRMNPGLPGAVVLMPGETVFSQPKMLILPLLTLTLVEFGYVARMTRASVVEVMAAPYVRTATLKGLPRRRIIFRHILPSALIAPITVIMLHVNWLIGGIVIVEAMFGFPGLGLYLLEAAQFGDIYAIEAGAIVMVLVAINTQLLADLAYTMLNPRIRYE